MSHVPGSIVLILALAFVSSANGQPEVSFPLTRVWSVAAKDLRADRAPPATHALRLHLATVAGGRWDPRRIAEGVRGAAALLAQCGIEVVAAELDEIDAPPRYRMFGPAVSRELARRTAFEKPAVFFVDDTQQRPAFDAEAIGRANATNRPELVDTVWITAATTDLSVALAHELFHLLVESGAHSDAPRNLMRDETAAGNTELTTAQCAAARRAGTEKGLLVPVASPTP